MVLEVRGSGRAQRPKLDRAAVKFVVAVAVVVVVVVVDVTAIEPTENLVAVLRSPLSTMMMLMVAARRCLTDPQRRRLGSLVLGVGAR